MRDLLVPFDFETPALRQVGQEVARVNGVNLAQGLCLLPTPPEVLEGAHAAMKRGHNRYTLPQGCLELREALATRLRTWNKIESSAESVIVTCGSTGAFEIVCEAFLRPGDEVVSFIPFYPYHRNTLKRRGVHASYVTLSPPDWSFSVEELRQKVSSKTKFILLTNPGNPTGKVFTASELAGIAAVAEEFDILIVTDEVYEYLTYDGRSHISMAALPGMTDRTITMGSYSKTFAITGWRIGYLNAPLRFYEVLKAINDQIFICPPAPLQHGVAHGILTLGDEYYRSQLQKYTRKRDVLCAGLERAGLPPSVPQGAYYIVADTSKRFPGEPSESVVAKMIERAKVAGVPASDFLGPSVKGDGERSAFIRFAYSVEDDLIERAVDGLRDW